jgi:hypothetical protein
MSQSSSVEISEHKSVPQKAQRKFPWGGDTHGFLPKTAHGIRRCSLARITPTVACYARVEIGLQRKMAKRGKRIEATSELIEAVLSDLARGLTREWACALNGVSHDTWQRWEKRPEFSELRARAIGARVKHLLERLEVEPNLAIAKSLQWLLERIKSYQNQFAPQGGRSNSQFSSPGRVITRVRTVSPAQRAGTNAVLRMSKSAEMRTMIIE